MTCCTNELLRNLIIPLTAHCALPPQRLARSHEAGLRSNRPLDARHLLTDDADEAG